MKGSILDGFKCAGMAILLFVLFVVPFALKPYLNARHNRKLRPTEFLTFKKAFLEDGLSKEDLKEGVYFYTLTNDVSYEGYERVVTINRRTYWRVKPKDR